MLIGKRLRVLREQRKYSHKARLKRGLAYFVATSVGLKTGIPYRRLKRSKNSLMP